MAASELLARKERLGRAASYGQIAKRVGHSKSLVLRILKGGEIPFDIDTPTILRKIEKALLQIELEQMGDEHDLATA